MRGEANRLLFDASEVLLAAKHLIGRQGINQSVPNEVTYLNLLFEEYELIKTEGSWSESFQPAEHALNVFESEQREDLFMLFPELKIEKDIEDYAWARLSLKGFGADLLCFELQF